MSLKKTNSTWFSEWARRKIMAKWRLAEWRALEEEIVSPTLWTTYCPGHEQKDSTSTIFILKSFFKLRSFQTVGEIKDFCSYSPKCLRFDWEKRCMKKCVLGSQNQTNSYTKFWKFHDTYPSSVLQFGSLENSSWQLYHVITNGNAKVDSVRIVLEISFSDLRVKQVFVAY